MSKPDFAMVIQYKNSCFISNYHKQFGDGKDVYAVVHVTGFLRPWSPTGLNLEDSESLNDVNIPTAHGANADSHCLVGVARLQVRLELYCELMPCFYCSVIFAFRKK